MSDESRVAAVVLAAGASSRMGENKLLLELDGDTVLRRAVTSAVAAGFDPVLVVTGHRAAQAGDEVEGLPCTVVHNPDHEQGIHTSVKTGVGHLPESVRAAVVMLADMPFVTADMLRELLARYREHDAPLVISQYGDVNAPPMLYDRSLFGEIAVMQRRCGKEVIERHRDEAVVVRWPEAALADLDTPDDYRRIAEAIAARPSP